VPSVETDGRHSHVRRTTACSTSTVMTFAEKVGRTWVARDRAGVAYDRHDALKNEAAYARHKIYGNSALLHYTHLPLAELCTTYSQTNRLNCIHNVDTCTGPHLNEASALTVNCHTSLCIHSHPERKEKKRKKTFTVVMVLENAVALAGFTELLHPPRKLCNARHLSVCLLVRLLATSCKKY